MLKLPAGKRKYKRSHPEIKLSETGWFRFSDTDWDVLCGHYKFDVTKNGTTGFARMFIESVVDVYCRDVLIEATKISIRTLLKNVVIRTVNLQPVIDELRDINNRKQGYATFPLIGEGTSSFNLSDERFDEYQNFVGLVKGCLGELPKIKSGPKDPTVAFLVEKIDGALKNLSPDSGIAASDIRWQKPKSNQRFLAAIFKMTYRVTGKNISAEKIVSVLHKTITKINKSPRIVIE